MQLRERRWSAGGAVVVGAGLIGATLRLPRGSGRFYGAGFALAAVWLVIALACGPVRWWGDLLARRDQLLGGIALAGLTFGLFVGGSAIGQRISVLAGPIRSVLGKADAGSVLAVLALTLINGVAEEAFFRGTLVDVLGERHRFVVAGIVYVGVSAVAGNTALTVAAVIMGAVFVVERRLSGGIVMSIVTHTVWSTLIILFLPR